MDFKNIIHDLKNLQFTSSFMLERLEQDCNDQIINQQNEIHLLEVIKNYIELYRGIYDQGKPAIHLSLIKNP